MIAPSEAQQLKRRLDALEQQVDVLRRETLRIAEAVLNASGELEAIVAMLKRWEAERRGFN